MNKKLLLGCIGAFALGFAMMYFNLQAAFLLGMVIIVVFSMTAGPKLEQNPDEEQFKRDRRRIINMMWIAFFYVVAGFTALFVS